MQLETKIMLDNDAYQSESREVKIANHLHAVREMILAGATNGSIWDSDGNKIGVFEIQAAACDIDTQKEET